MMSRKDGSGMKNPTQTYFDSWYGDFITTTQPKPRINGVPAPEEPYSPEPPINSDHFRNSITLNIH